MCDALEKSTDVRELWRAVENETDRNRKSRSVLQGSDVIRDILGSASDDEWEKVTLSQAHVQNVAVSADERGRVGTEEEGKAGLPKTCPQPQEIDTVSHHQVSSSQASLAQVDHGDSSQQHSHPSPLINQVRKQETCAIR